MIAMVSRFVTIPYKRPHYKYQVSYDKSYTTWQVLFAFHQERCLRLSLGDGSILSAMKSYVPLILLSCPWGPCRPLGRRRRQLLGRVFPSWSSRPCRPRRWSQGCRLIFCWSRWWERGRVQRWQEWLSKRILPLFWKLFEKRICFQWMIRIMVRTMMCHFYVYPFGSDPVMYLKTVEKEWNLLSSLEGEFVILFSVLLCQLGVVKSLESNFTSPSYQISNAFSIAINIATCNHHQNHHQLSFIETKNCHNHHPGSNRYGTSIKTCGKKWWMRAQKASPSAQQLVKLVMFTFWRN